MNRGNPDALGAMQALLPMLSLGRCIPSSCSTEDVVEGFKGFFTASTGGNSSLVALVQNCHFEEEEKTLHWDDWLMISIVLLFILIVSVGTLIDVALNHLKLDFIPDVLIQVFQGFSAYSNTVKIFSTGAARPDSLACINGIRFISMTWVLFGHGFGQMLVTAKNIAPLLDANGPFFGNLAFEPMLNAFPSVDSFFFIGATLLSYTTLKALDTTKGGNIKFWIMYYVHRYIRLTGVYAVILGLMATLYRFCAYGPNSAPMDLEHRECRETLWTNLLYVNNLHWVTGHVSECMGETWYMANDMQFFVISPIFLLAIWKSTMLGLILGLLALVAGTIAPMVVIYQNDFPLSMLDFTDAERNYYKNFYIVPWCRFQPYIVGLLFGWLLHRLRDQPKLKLSPFLVTWIWAVAGTVGALVIYGLHPYEGETLNPDSDISMTLRVVYGGLHRVAWSVCLGWVILASVKHSGGPINSILSWHAWVPLARLSYCIYLVHLKVMPFTMSLPSFSVHYTHALGVYWVLAMLCLSIFVAYIMVILFEAPIVHLEKIVFASFGVGSLPTAKKAKASLVD
jgi:peptidoglycan/LPS O-acetylase OafA/YrhL